MSLSPTIRAGTAGWRVPEEHAAAFPAEGSHLERYTQVFGAAEINSSFYRPHRRTTYERWAASVPEMFRFAVRIPKAIPHQHQLRATGEPLGQFLSEVGGLGSKLGPPLVQHPPSLGIELRVADRSLENQRQQTEGHIACEPRHRSWFRPEVDGLLDRLRIGRVAADPGPAPSADQPGGWAGLTYYRLHGSPRVYYSPYDDVAIQAVMDQLGLRAAGGSACWCIFDNTAASAATGNALAATGRWAALAAER